MTSFGSPISAADRRPARRSRAASPADASSPPRLIGVGVDGTHTGLDAVVLGSLLAGAPGAELLLIAVHEEPLIQVPMPKAAAWSTLQKQALASAAQARDAVAPGARVTVEADVLVWRALRRVARREHRDLLVVGSTHHADDGCIHLGRSAGELLGHLECPLAVAPSGLRDRRKRTLERIGVGFTGSPESRAAFALASAIASVAGAELAVRRAVEDADAGRSFNEHMVPGDPPEVESRLGVASDVLFELAEYVDLLVIGSGRSRRAGRVDLGETGRALLNGAPCPILVALRPAAR